MRRSLLVSLAAITLVACREQSAPGPARGPALEPAAGDAGAPKPDGAAAAGGQDGAAESLSGMDTAGADAGGKGGDAWPDAMGGQVAEGLVGWWRLDEGEGAQAADSSGRANQGELVDVPAAAWITGRQGRGLALRSAGAHVRIPSSVSINGVYRAFSITAFLNQDAASPERGTILARQGGYALGLVTGRPFLSMALEGRSAPVEFAAVEPAAAGRWVHLAAVFDGSASRLFLDGKEVASLAVTGTVGNSNVPITIGARLVGTALSEPLGAALDEVRLYARALTVAEIVSLATEP